MDFREKKHLVLLAMILLLLGAQPFAHGFVFGFIVFDVLVVLATVATLLIVFDRGRGRPIMFLFAFPAVACSVLLHVVSGEYYTLCASIYHGTTALFFGGAVAVILHNAFHKQHITVDQIIAGVNGFLIAGVAWGNLYLLVHLLAPGSYHLNPTAAAEMSDMHSQRFEFNHLSFAILSGVGFDNITPAGRLARTLSWMEASFGMFYVAVILGLLVGLQMSGSQIGPSPSKPANESGSDESSLANE